MDKKILFGGIAFGAMAYFLTRKKLIEINVLTDSLYKSDTKTYPKRSLSDINKIIVHHSATQTGSAESYAKYHVQNRGWAGIGYHYVIDQDGTINQTNNLDTISNHVSGENSVSIGICLTGDFDYQTPFPKQIESLSNLIAYLRGIFEQKLQVDAHRDFSSKTCPGLNIDIQMYKLPSIA